MTKQPSKHAKKGVSYEIDTDLKQNLLSLGCENVIFHFEDALKKDLALIEGDFNGKYKLVANLPYYITTPLLFKFLKSKRLISITVMVQKEVAERMCSSVGDKNYGLLSVSCAFYGKCKIMRKVSRKMFSPQPDVDSCVVRLDMSKTACDEEKFFKVVKAAFSKRRKTLLNTLAEGLNITKEELKKASIDLTKRAEELSLQQFVELTKTLDQNFNI